MRVNPALVKDRKNSGFSKKPGKRRLARSTQFSRNRILGAPAPRTTPSHQRPLRLGFPSEDGNYSLCDFPRSVKELDLACPAGGHQFPPRRGAEKEPRTLAGDAQYRVRRRPCQGISEKS